MDKSSTTYLGITIGPIVDTMMLSSKPAALWLSSYMFSFISRRIYLNLAAGISRKEIITPYIPTDEINGESADSRVAAAFSEGIGIHHDRIILMGGDGREELVRKAIAAAIAELSSRLAASEAAVSNSGKAVVADAKSWNSFLNRYLQIYTVAVDVEETESPLLKVTEYLEVIEQQKRFMPVVADDSNLLGKLIAVKGEHANAIIKRAATGEGGLDVDMSKWQLRHRIDSSGNVTIKDLAHIADGLSESAPNLKLRSYYAFIHSDGDNMGALLKSFGGNTEKIHRFSACCIDYAIRAKDIVARYGGVTIYAGGDDLCCLVPVKSGEGTVFDFLREIEKCFNGAFASISKDVSPRPSISSGVFISQHHFPLYEALDNSLSLLYEAKQIKDKNTIALKVRKHSGQQFGITFSKTTKQFMLEDPLGRDGVYGDMTDGRPLCPLARVMRMIRLQENEQAIRSVRELLRRQSVLLNAAYKESDDEAVAVRIRNIFRNTFDADVHTKARDFIDMNSDLLLSLQSGYTGVMQSARNSTVGTYKADDRTELKIMDSLLSLIRFFSEEGNK